MKIGFIVNDIATEKAGYTTVRLAMTAHRLGHDAFMMGLGDLGYEPDGTLSAKASAASGKVYRSHERYLADVQKPEVNRQIALGEFDVVMLRSDPAQDAAERPWAPTAGVAFGKLMAEAGVLVVNDPDCLSGALSKAYFQHFPEAVRPHTLITRQVERITSFIDELGGRAVLKPLQGSGGSGVFLVDRREAPNVNQIVEAIARDGYVVVQEYLPEAAEGDVRLFLMNGEPLRVGGEYAAFKRFNASADMRSNVSAGGEIQPTKVTDKMLAVAEAVRPKLIADGMFLVGLDIVGDKLMEVNVFSPGGLGISQNIYEADFTVAVIESLEHKVGMRAHYGRELTNRRLATL